MQLNKEQIHHFQKFIWHIYKEQGRSFAWRNCDNPYAVVVSEIMLQQTQTHRVAPKFDQFMAAFPSWKELAHASVSDVISAWQGLGYNRRALALQKIAHKVVYEHHEILPNNPEILVTFPGIGPATAASISAFAFNIPTVFIETNIRTVFIHTFFKDQTAVYDKELLPLVTATLDTTNPREWYYALMDYGVMLKKMHPNPSRKSKHHIKQSKFEGSFRQIRGAILRLLTQHPTLTKQQLIERINKGDERITKALQQLHHEGFIVYASPDELRLTSVLPKK